MSRWKPVKAELLGGENIEIKTETGHIIKCKLKANVLVDLDQDDNGNPFFFIEVPPTYDGVELTKNSMTLETVRNEFENKNIIPDNLEYDHIQVGFAYTDANDPNNHKWMLHFMDVNNNVLSGFYGTEISIDCPFTTFSWDDGVWHGRFVVYKKDVKLLREKETGKFVLEGYGKGIEQQKVNPIDEKVKSIILRFNNRTNMWYCDLHDKKQKIGEMPCKNIICDVPFSGSIDYSAQPKVKASAVIDISKIEGISMALNALIIKSK